MELRKHPFFRNMEAAHADALCRNAIIQKLPEGSVIFEEGDLSDHVYLILEGTVGFSKRIPNRSALAISTSTVNEYFGEVGVLANDRRSLRAEAKTDCVIACLPGAAIVEYLHNLPGPVQGLLNSIINHLHDTTRHFVEDRFQQEKMALVGSMTNTIIHDFKNPFCLISLSAQLLRQRHRDEESRKLCQNIEKQVDRMVSMSTELSEFSRGEHTIAKSKIPLKELFEEFRSLNQPYFTNSRVKVEIAVPKIDILGSKAKLFRVLQNLLDNALQAFGEKEGFVRITGEIDHPGQMIVLKMEDNAGGIPEPIRERFFDPFVSHGKKEGTGLGTAIARSIIEAHGGSIHFRTETGRGTIFFIKLPLAH